MNEATRSVPDIAEELMREFESLVAVSTVTEVVMRLSRKGHGTLAALADLAREELSALATGTASSAQNLVGVVVPNLEMRPGGP